MKRKLHLLALAGALAASPVHANGVREPTFAEKMALADMVLVGTVIRADGPAVQGFGLADTATLTVLDMIKGEAMDMITVATSSTVAELNPRCCEVGATYLMFLRRTPDGRYISVRGIYGMVRIGGSTNRDQFSRDR
jgi:hypothetical protein